MVLCQQGHIYYWSDTVKICRAKMRHSSCLGSRLTYIAFPLLLYQIWMFACPGVHNLSLVQHFLLVSLGISSSPMPPTCSLYAIIFVWSAAPLSASGTPASSLWFSPLAKSLNSSPSREIKGLLGWLSSWHLFSYVLAPSQWLVGHYGPDLYIWSSPGTL